MGSDPSEIWVDLVIVSHCTWWQMNFTGYPSSKTNTLTTAYHCHCWNSGVLLIQWKRCLSLDATGTKFFIMRGNADHFYNIVLWWKVASPPIPELVWMVNYLACYSAEPEEFTLVILDYPTQRLKVAAHLARILVFWNSTDVGGRRTSAARLIRDSSNANLSRPLLHYSCSKLWMLRRS